MTLAIDMVGTRLGSGTRTYNINFCKYISTYNIDQKIFIFITKDYLKNIKINHNQNVKYLIKSSLLTNIFFRIFWMQFILPFELKKLKVNQLFSPMNMSPLILKIFNIKLTLALHSNLPWIYFNMMPGNFLRNIFTKFLMQFSINVCDKLIVDSEFAKSILDGTADLREVTDDKITQLLLELMQKEKTVNIQITREDMMNKYKKWNEKTTTSPSGRHLGHFHALFRAFSYTDDNEKKEIEKMRDKDSI